MDFFRITKMQYLFEAHYFVKSVFRIADKSCLQKI